MAIFDSSINLSYIYSIPPITSIHASHWKIYHHCVIDAPGTTNHPSITRSHPSKLSYILILNNYPRWTSVFIHGCTFLTLPSIHKMHSSIHPTFLQDQYICSVSPHVYTYFSLRTCNVRRNLSNFDNNPRDLPRKKLLVLYQKFVKFLQKSLWFSVKKTKHLAFYQTLFSTIYIARTPRALPKKPYGWPVFSNYTCQKPCKFTLIWRKWIIEKNRVRFFLVIKKTNLLIGGFVVDPTRRLPLMLNEGT